MGENGEGMKRMRGRTKSVRDLGEGSKQASVLVDSK